MDELPKLLVQDRVLDEDGLPVCLTCLEHYSDNVIDVYEAVLRVRRDGQSFQEALAGYFRYFHARGHR